MEEIQSKMKDKEESEITEEEKDELKSKETAIKLIR